MRSIAFLVTLLCWLAASSLARAEGPLRLDTGLIPARPTTSSPPRGGASGCASIR